MFVSFLRALFRFRRPAARPKSRNHVALYLETLEERWVPSTMDGALSLHSLLGTSFTSPSTSSAVTSNTTTSSPVASNTATSSSQQVTAVFNAFKTGGSESQSVAQFDPSQGTLNSIQILYNGQLTSDVKVENLDSAPSTVNAQVNGNLALQGMGATLLSVTPTINENSTSLSAYDGTLDYGGTSGHDFGPQSATAQKSITLTNNLSAWEGTGKVTLTATAQSTSTVSGSGNEQVNIASDASGSVGVIYNFTPKPSTPPPGPSAPPPAPSPSPSPAPSPPPSCNCDCDSTPPSGPATIQGLVYLDPSKAGHYAQGDPGVNQVTVTLTGTTLTGQQVAQTATTGSSGQYSFTGLQPGRYALSDLPIPAAYTAGAATLGNYGGVVANGDLVLALPQGGDAVNYDFGLVTVPSSTPSGPPVAPPSGSTTPPASTPSTAPTPTPTPSPAPATMFDPPIVLSKRALIGDGWQSLG